MKNIIQKGSLLLVLMFLVTFLTFSNVSANNPLPTSFINLDESDPQWGKPIFGFGSGLTNEDIVLTAQILGIKDWNQVQPLEITAQDRIRLVDPNADPNSQMFSSVLIQRLPKGTGARVQVLTPDMITRITAAQYSSAALTAGITDAKIVVASVKLATGESALTGVYKAYAEQGQPLPDKRVKLAQEELEVISGVANENSDKEGFDIGLFDQAMVALKEELMAEKDKADTSGPISIETIQVTIQNVINNYHLGDVITGDQINRLTQYFSKWVESDAADNQDLKEELKSLGETLKEFGGQLYNDAKEAGVFEKLKEEAGKGYDNLKETDLWKDLEKGARYGLEELKKPSFWEKVVDFFRSIIESFKGN